MPRATKSRGRADRRAFPSEAFVHDAIAAWAKARRSKSESPREHLLETRDATSGLQALVCTIGADAHDILSRVHAASAVAFANSQPNTTAAVASPDLPVFREAASDPRLVLGGRRCWWLFVAPDGSVAEVPPPPVERAAVHATFRLRPVQSSILSGTTA